MAFGKAVTGFTALVLAGSRQRLDPVAAYGGVSDKALIHIAGETMLAHVVDALRQAGAARIAVSASSAAVADHARALGAEVFDAAGGPSLSARHGLERLGAPLLITTADHALLEPQWIEQLLTEAPADRDVCVLLARRQAVEAAAPATKRTYLRFADADWSGCNLFLCATMRALAAIDFWQQLEQDRKRPWRIVLRLGPVKLLRYLAGGMSLPMALDLLGQRAGVRVGMVAASSGGAAIDVDTPADLDLVRRLRAAAVSDRGAASATSAATTGVHAPPTGQA
jgi:GTP:adenosylcobinamide-phosphate guanylyltransferase